MNDDYYDIEGVIPSKKILKYEDRIRLDINIYS